MTQLQPSPFGQPRDIFDQSPDPAYWTPFSNMRTGGGMGGQAIQGVLGYLAQSMGGPQNFPAQYKPSQNMWDQIQAQSYWRGQQEAAAWASHQDVVSMQQTAQGFQRAAQGFPSTPQQQQQIRGMTESAGKTWLPIAAMMFPQITDMLMGERGSSIVMAQAMHRGLRSSRDPFTGGLGVRGRSAGMMSQEVFSQLYGPGADMAEMRGLRAGQVGGMFEELQRRGLAGVSVGAQTPQERMQRVAGTTYGVGERRRAAEAYLRGQGQEVTSESIGVAQDKIFGQGGTLNKIRAGVSNGSIDVQRMMEMPGAEEILTTSQSQTITRRLKNMSGAVSAMIDIFGDAGNPTAPMREIIASLDQLTQGGMATMSPGALEQMVRTTRNVAEASGLGLNGMQVLTARGAGLADALGLDRTLAVGAARQGALRGMVARQTYGGGQRPYGGLSPEEQVLLENQLQLTGAASPIGNMLNATVRMHEQGLIDANSDGARLADAVKKGQTEWTNNAGERKSAAMNNQQWANLMQGSGVTRGVAESILADPYGSQFYERRFGITENVTRRLQREVDLEPRLANVFSDKLGRQVNETGMGRALLSAGMNNKQIRNMVNAASAQVATGFFDIDAATMAKGEGAVSQEMARLTEAAVEQQIRAQGGSDRAVRRGLRALGPVDLATGVREGALETGAAMLAGMGTLARTDRNFAGYGKNYVGVWEMTNMAGQQQQRALNVEMQTTGRMQTAMSRVGRHGPVARIIGALQGSPENLSVNEIISKTIVGFQSPEDLEDTALGGLRTALRDFHRAGNMRYTEASSLQVAINEEMAQRASAGTLTDGVALERLELRTNQEFLDRTKASRAARVGMITAEGQAQRDLSADILQGLTAGSADAEAARLQIAKSLGGEDATIGTMTDPWWAAQREEAARQALGGGSKEQLKRIDTLQRTDMILQAAQRGEVTSTQLRDMGFTTEQYEKESEVLLKQRQAKEASEAAIAASRPKEAPLAALGQSADTTRVAGDRRQTEEAKLLESVHGGAAPSPSQQGAPGPTGADVARGAVGPAGAPGGGQSGKMHATISGTLNLTNGEVTGALALDNATEHNDVQVLVVGPK